MGRRLTEAIGYLPALVKRLVEPAEEEVKIVAVKAKAAADLAEQVSAFGEGGK